MECTGSLPNSEVKPRKARIVLGWVTAREVLRVLLTFFFFENPAFSETFAAIHGDDAEKFNQRTNRSTQVVTVAN